MFTFTPLRVRGDADDDNSMLLVLVSLPALPTPTTCAHAVATLNADEALAKEFAAYNKTDCMSYDFDPKNQSLESRNCTELATPYETACTAAGGAVYNETRWIQMFLTNFKHTRVGVHCLPTPDACSPTDVYGLAKAEMDKWCQQFSMYLVVACSVGYHPPTTVEMFA